MTGRVRTGTAGWHYPDWDGVVYPRPVSNRLAYLSRYLQAVEINVTFYRPPRKESILRWLSDTAAAADFRFTAKLWRGFTHNRKEYSRREGEEWEKAMVLLLESGRLGALLAQFPYSFHRRPENIAYLKRLKRRFAGWPLVVEFRHRSWDREEVFGLLRDEGIGFCNIDQPLVSYSLPPTTVATSPTAYVRFHGRNAAAWFDRNAGRDKRYDYLYSETEIGEWVERINLLRERSAAVYVIANNHFLGQAVCNCLELQSRFKGGPVPVPDPLAVRYPRLGKIRSGGQLRLDTGVFERIASGGKTNPPR